jgi:hypothetical protein
MKWVVWGLLLLNVMLLAYFNLSTAYPTQARHPAIQPEKIKLLTPQEVESLPKKTAEMADIQASLPAPVQFGCYEWGSFSKANLARARNILTKFSINATIKQQTTPEATRYWVYIPPAKSLQAAQAKVEELRGLGVQDIFVVLEPQWRHAISFGVFKDEQLANKLLEELKNKGVIAIKGARNQEKGQASLLMNNMSSDTAAEIDKLKPDFPGSELKQATCQ